MCVPNCAQNCQDIKCQDVCIRFFQDQMFWAVKSKLFHNSILTLPKLLVLNNFGRNLWVKHQKWEPAELKEQPMSNIIFIWGSFTFESIYIIRVLQSIGHILYCLLYSMTIKHIFLNVQKNHFLKWLEGAQIPPPFRTLIVRTKDQSACMKPRFPPSLKCVWITIFISLSLAPPAVAHCVLFWMLSAFNGRPYSQPPFRAIRGLFTLIVQ